jgi:hypothetical protein
MVFLQQDSQHPVRRDQTEEGAIGVNDPETVLLVANGFGRCHPLDRLLGR